LFIEEKMKEKNIYSNPMKEKIKKYLAQIEDLNSFFRKTLTKS